MVMRAPRPSGSCARDDVRAQREALDPAEIAAVGAHRKGGGDVADRPT
jgi:hypothetical protein